MATTPIPIQIGSMTRRASVDAEQHSLGPRGGTQHLVYLAVVVSAGAFVAWYAAVEHVGSAEAGLFVGIVPVAALLTAAILGSTVLDPVRLAGVVAVGAGLVVGISHQRPQVGLT